jgi:hypothetical protein
MNPKIHNPYEDLLKTVHNPQTEGEYQLRTLYKTMMLVFNDGVKAAQAATAPHKFWDKSPEEGQRIIAFDRLYNCGCFIYEVPKSDVHNFTYTHWLPYPELD